MADKLRTARTITLNGDVTGSTTFDGSGDVTITAEVAADSHGHDSQYLRRDGANTMTGNVTFNSSNIDHYISFITDTTHNWRIGYTGTGSGNNNLLVFQSTKDTKDTWNNALTFGCETLNATFAGKIIAPKGLQGNADTASKFQTAQTITVAGDATGSVTFDGSEAKTLSLDIGSADQLSSNYKINGTAFNGSKDITTASWGTARNVSITDGTNTGTATSMGAATSGSYSLKLPTTIKATLTGNASTATSLAKAVTIALAGDVSGSASFNGAGDITINTEVADDSHLHTKLKSSGFGTQSSATGMLAEAGGYTKFYYGFSNSCAGLFPANNYANTILAISRHNNANYNSQLGFSSNGSIYYRAENGTAFTDETEWKKLAFISDNVASASKWQTARTLTLKGGANGNVTFDGSKNVECEVTITDDSHLHDSTYVRRDGATPMSESLTIQGVNKDLFVNFLHSGSETGYDWRIGNLGSGAGDANYFVIQSNGISGTWIDVMRAGLTSYDVTFVGDVTAASFIGNASSASKWQTARTITLTGGATGSVSIDGSADKNLAVTVTNDGHHHSNSTIDSLDASKITSGTISISRLPQGALERLVVVADDTARFKLTTSNVQLGDVVKVIATDVMYFVKDTANLGNANGYELFAAGRAASVNWANIENVPTLKLAGDATGEIDLSGVAASGKVLNVTIADDSHAHNSQYLRRDGANYMTGNIVFAAGNTDKAIEFTSNASGTVSQSHSWKIVYEGSKDANNNYLSFQSTKTGTTWNRALYFESETLNATFGGTVTASKGFIGNASTATTLQTARNIALGGDVTGTATSFNGSADITINTVVTSAQTGFAVNAAEGNPSILNLMRPGTNLSSWRIRNESGNLYFDCNYTNKIVGWYPAVTINYNNGNTTFKGNVTAPKFIGALQGNADTASKWATARKLSLTGDVTGETTFDGNANVSIEATVLDDSHAHNYIGKSGYLAYPAGNTHYASGTSTGALQITLPVKWTQNMMKFTVSIYNYLTDTAVDYIIGGYNFNDGKWYNPTAICLGKAGAALSNLKVRFCTDGTNPCVTIGETTTSWYYASISIHDITWGNQSNYSDFIKTWKMAFVTTLPTIHHTVENTHVGYNSVASSCLGNSATASKLATARTITLAGDLTGSVSFDGSENVTLTAAVTDDSHLHDGRYLKLAGGTMTGMISSKSGGSTWINGINNPAIKFTNTGYMGWISGGALDGRLGISSYANSDNKLYFLYFKQATLDAGTNTPDAKMSWDGPTNTLSATTFSGNATSASKWATARTLTIAGDATGSVSIDGSANKTLTLDVATAAKTDYALTVNVTNVADTVTTTTFNGSAAKTININASDFMPLTSFTKTLTLTTSWQDVGISSNNIANSGSYIIQILVNDGGTTGTLSNYSEYYTGVMSWYASNTNSTDTDEIILHKAGHASNSRYIYLRTVRTSAGTLKMQIAANVTATAASTLVIKVRQLI